jgi:hypothetical protein
MSGSSAKLEDETSLNIEEVSMYSSISSEEREGQQPVDYEPRFRWPTRRTNSSAVTCADDPATPSVTYRIVV